MYKKMSTSRIYVRQSLIKIIHRKANKNKLMKCKAIQRKMIIFIYSKIGERQNMNLVNE